MKPLAIAALLATTLTLTACGDAPTPPAETTTPPATTTPAPAPAPEPTPAPAPAPAPTTTETPALPPSAEITVNEAIENVQQQVDELQLTDAEKAKAIADAREQAETAAKNAGLNDAQVKQAGDAAEAAAKTVFNVQ